MKPDAPLHFDVSSGLKSVLGSELITADEVAIFELVKNSFDADATKVDLFFKGREIIVSDNGKGMTLDDVKNKWLFVAYSAKRSTIKSSDFRNTIAEHKHYAGSKGIGRFSSDRLGRKLILQTKSQKSTSNIIHCVEVDWDLFDKNHKEHFDKIDLIHRQLSSFELPSNLARSKHGTVIKIEETRKVWDRESILKLKGALAKLINPFGASADQFKIEIIAPDEKSEDRQEISRAKSRGEEVVANSIVNGMIGNSILKTLKEKTTYIEVKIDPQGKHLLSSLMDRGELIYRIREPLNFEFLGDSGFRCVVYFLNSSAKMTFAKRMGVPSVQFGSVFLFRNGFRVFPVGEEANDWFGMDRRKQQGYARFLGTRDVIGRIDVSGADKDFQEASSRNSGLIETKAVAELRDCFMEYCLKRLERYVVPVTFPDKEDRNTDDVSRLMTDAGKSRVASAVAKLVDHDNIELLEYSTKLISVLDERSKEFEPSLASIRSIADKTNDSRLFRKIKEAEIRFEELRTAEKAATERADQERVAKEKALSRAVKAEKQATEAEAQLNEEKKRNLFLTSLSSLDIDTILNLHHQITIYTVRINQQISNFMVKNASKESMPREAVVNILEGISLLNQQVMGIAKFATKANFRLTSEMIEADLIDYIKQYIEEVAPILGPENVEIGVDTGGKQFPLTFKPIDVSIIIDNLVDNAFKAGASRIRFDLSQSSSDVANIKISDNGRGFDRGITELSRIFEKGFTRTRGSGLGLYHVHLILSQMKGSVEAVREATAGAVFNIRITK